MQRNVKVGTEPEFTGDFDQDLHKLLAFVAAKRHASAYELVLKNVDGQLGMALVYEGKQVAETLDA